MLPSASAGLETASSSVSHRVYRTMVLIETAEDLSHSLTICVQLGYREHRQLREASMGLERSYCKLVRPCIKT